jgi:DNA-nicking Smr family endonuclease
MEVRSSASVPTERVDPLTFSDSISRKIAAMSAHDDDEDLSAFRKAMEGVQRSPETTRIVIEKPLPSAQPRQSRLDELAVLAEMLDGPDPETFESGDTLSYRSQGIQDSVFRKLRRGSYRLEGEVDLHGLNRDKAKGAVAVFLAHCQDRGWRCVRIIHGKGNGSPNSGPVIKSLLDGWLRKRREVLAFCSARPHDGGTGAIYVLLRAN